MRFTIASMILALQLAAASAVPRAETLEFSTLQGIEPFNTTFAEAHLADLEGPVIASASDLSTRATGNVYVCINANFQPACSVVHWGNDVCGKSFTKNQSCQPPNPPRPWICLPRSTRG